MEENKFTIPRCIIENLTNINVNIKFIVNKFIDGITLTLLQEKVKQLELFERNSIISNNSDACLRSQKKNLLSILL